MRTYAYENGMNISISLHFFTFHFALSTTQTFNFFIGGSILTVSAIHIDFRHQKSTKFKMLSLLSWFILGIPWQIPEDPIRNFQSICEVVRSTPTHCAGVHPVCGEGVEGYFIESVR